MHTPPLPELTRGFLPERDPATALPGELSLWDEVGRELPRLLVAGRVRSALEKLPVLDPTPLLEDERLALRALSVLAFLGNAAVYEKWRQGPTPVVPRAVAVPITQLSERLQIPPVLTYSAYILNNWRRLDPDGPLVAENLAVLQNLLGGLDEDWFVLMHVEIEAKAAPLLSAIPPAERAVAEDDPLALTRSLEAIRGAFAQMNISMARMFINCDPYIFYHRVRPPADGFHKPVLFEGAPGWEAPVRFAGGTAAQSTIVPMADAALSIHHAQDDTLAVYLRELRRYMPPSHRAHVAALEARPGVRPYVVERKDSHPALRDSYNGAIHALAEFRKAHIDFAATYIAGQAGATAGTQPLRGTGGTPFAQYLQKHYDETLRCVV